MYFQATNNYCGLEMKEAPTLFLEFHSSEAGLEGQTQLLADIAADNGGSDFEYAQQTEDRNKLWSARHKLYHSAINLIPGCRSVTTDVCVPISTLPDMVLRTREDVEKSGITGNFMKKL